LAKKNIFKNLNYGIEKMINFSFLVLTLEEKSGGLFDFDGTLSVIAVQFLVLMLLLNIILYEPILKTLDQRKIYVSNKTSSAKNIITEVDFLVEYYSKVMLDAQTKTQLLLKKTDLQLINILEQKIFKLQNKSSESIITYNKNLNNKIKSLSKSQAAKDYSHLIAALIMFWVIPKNQKKSN
jgi:F-type H+-transporting ATPase subunit b